jgi:hypothetical protein
MRGLISVDSDVKTHEGWSDVKISMVTPSYQEYDRLLKEHLRAADVIITTTPSTAPLFDPAILTSTEGRKRGRLIIAIGSYKPHMIELPVEILQQAVKPPHEHRHFHKHAVEGGVVIVDTLTGCLKEAGEIIQAGLTPHQLVELGELVMLEGHVTDSELGVDAQAESPEDIGLSGKASNEEGDNLDVEKLRASLKEISASGENAMASALRAGADSDNTTLVGSSKSRSTSKPRSVRKSFSIKSPTFKTLRSMSFDRQKAAEKEDAMASWLSAGNVVYKSVGFGLMDLVVGAELVRLANEKGIGTRVENF